MVNWSEQRQTVHHIDVQKKPGHVGKTLFIFFSGFFFFVGVR